MAGLPLSADGARLILAGAALGFLSIGSSSAGGVSPTTLALTDIYTAYATAYPVMQRKAGSENVAGGYGDVPVLVTFTGSQPTNLEARVVRASGGAVVKDWSPVENFLVNGNIGVGKLTGVTTGEKYRLEVRDGLQPNNAATTKQGSVTWGVGVLAMPYGQSNMGSTLQAGAFNDPVPGGTNEYQEWFDGKVPSALFGNSGWFQPNNSGNPSSGSDIDASLSGGTLYAMRALAAALKAKHGKVIPVGLIPWASSGKALSELTPSGAVGTRIFNKTGTTAGNIGMKSPGNVFCGDFEVLALNQGEAEAGRGVGFQVSERLADLKSFCGELHAHVAPFGRTPAQLAIVVNVPGSYTANFGGIESVRGGAYALEAHAKTVGWNVKTWSCLDMDAADGDGDGSHFGQLGANGKPYRKIAVRRMMQAFAHATGCSDYSADGPRMVSATRVNLIATVTVQHNGGNQLVSYAGSGTITGFSAVEKVSGVARVPTIAITGAGTFSATFPAGTVFPVLLTHCAGKTPDVSNLLSDNAEFPFVNNGSGGNVFTGTDAYSKIPLQYGSIEVT